MATGGRGSGNEQIEMKEMTQTSRSRRQQGAQGQQQAAAARSGRLSQERIAGLQQQLGHQPRPSTPLRDTSLAFAALSPGQTPAVPPKIRPPPPIAPKGPVIDDQVQITVGRMLYESHFKGVTWHEGYRRQKGNKESVQSRFDQATRGRERPLQEREGRVGDWKADPKGSGWIARQKSWKAAKWSNKVMIRRLDFNQMQRSYAKLIRVEVTILTTLKHKYILRLFGTVNRSPYMYMVFEMCKWSLMQECAVHKDESGRMIPFDARQVKIWMGCIAQALVYMHSINIVHCRIHPASVLIRGPNSAVLTRLLASQKYSGPGSVTDHANVNHYSSPAMLSGDDNWDAKAADVWAFGCMIFRLLQGFDIHLSQPGFRGQTVDQRQAMTQNLLEEYIEQDDARDLLNMMLALEDDDRASSFKVVAHHFFATDHHRVRTHDIYGGPEHHGNGLWTPYGTFFQLGNAHLATGIFQEMETEGFFVQHMIGYGAYGQVFAGIKRDQQTGQDIEAALKVISGFRAKKRRWYTKNGYPLEMELMRRVDHPNIVRILAVYQEKYVNSSRPYDRRGFIWMERAKCGLWFLMEASQGEGLPEERIKKYMLDVVNGLCYLYDYKICHRDLKPDNILITHDDVAQLTDFSFVKMIDHTRLIKEWMGTERYMSPQGLTHVAMNPFKMDVWSLGITMLHCFRPCTRDAWFTHEDTLNPDRLELAWNEKLLPDIQARPMSPNARLLLIDMLKFEDYLRPTIKTVLTHPWFNPDPEPPTTGCTCLNCRDIWHRFRQMVRNRRRR